MAFVSLVSWGRALGLLGPILAVPADPAGQVVPVDIDPRARWADTLLREQAVQP
ncbi:MAG TPA: hypothetical protein VIL00_03565 [Pseudonocardiaceae bacterium]